MRPIEFIQSIDRQAAAEQVQRAQSHDPKDVTGDLTVRQLQEETKIKEVSVNEADPKNIINPDDSKKNEETPDKSRKEKKEKTSENKDHLEQDPDKGQKLDIVV